VVEIICQASTAYKHVVIILVAFQYRVSRILLMGEQNSRYGAQNNAKQNDVNTM
jgi:hypothetical protein